MVRFLLAVLVPISLSGCGYLFGDDGHFRDRSMDYQTAKVTASMKLPDDLHTNKIQELYPIPNVVESAALDRYEPKEAKDVPRPISVLSFFKDGSIEVRRVGDEDWIWVRQSKEHLLDVVAAFWRENHIAIDNKDDESGFIETVWVSKTEKKAGENLWAKSSSGVKKVFTFREHKQKFRVVIVPGDDEHQSKVLLSHA
ncbi:MAG: outer membrane protein assembly factor BamC, partial [Pseudomonadales bacterium]|nr:outer membrane protein assembly factor BamC [Pseudomonadales bacterium]